MDTTCEDTGGEGGGADWGSAATTVAGPVLLRGGPTGVDDGSGRVAGGNMFAVAITTGWVGADVGVGVGAGASLGGEASATRTATG